MPYPSEGLTFGNFSVDEWERFFGAGAQRSNLRPPVEFLLEFESDHEDQGNTNREVHGLRQESSSKNIPTGPEDSGVEVGQESEQESLPPKPDVSEVCVSDNVQAKVTTSGGDGGHKKAKDCGTDISFGGASMIEDKDTGSSNTSPGIPQDSENFPPLGGPQVHEVDRSRKRRRKRKQHQRSGDVPCSSSEDSDRDRSPASTGERASRGRSDRDRSPASTGERASRGRSDMDRSPASTGERVSRGRSGSGQVVADKSTGATDGKGSPADVDEPKGAIIAGNKENTTPTQENQDASSSTDSKSTTETVLSIGETSSSPMQSDVDLHASQTPNEKSTGPPEVKTSTDSKSKTEPSKAGDVGPNDKNDVAKPAAVPAPSWADLVRNSSKPSTGVVIMSSPSVPKVEVTQTSNKKPEEPLPSVIPIVKDKQAITIAEMMKKATLDNDNKHVFLRGLINRGNWCYINATLQAFLACPPFFNLLRQIQPLAERGSTSTPILDCLVKFFHEFNLQKQATLPQAKNNKLEFRTGSPFEPAYVYKMLSTIQSNLSLKGRQEDAQEFLSCVLNGIHEEMLQLSKLLQPVLKSDQQLTDLPATDGGGLVKGEDFDENDDSGDWEQVGPRNKSSITRMASFPQSLISEIFGGYLRSSLHQAGAKESANVEPFFDLQLDIQNVNCIEDALNHLAVKEELQGYTCSKTKAQIDVSRRVSFEGLPKILIMHLKRFIYSKSGSQKLQKQVDYPLELNIGKELLSPNVRNKYTIAQKTYKLCAVVYHHGKSASGGHYTADTLHPVHGWVHADDTRLKPVPPNFVLKPTQGKDPYLLYYRRTDQIP